jgi:hypothetical protein
VIDVEKNTSKKFHSIKEAYEELRQMFNFEQERFKNIENKAASFLVLDSILLTLISIFHTQENVFFIFIFISVLIAIICSVLVFKLRGAKRPHKDYEDFYKYAAKNKIELYDEFLSAYISSTKNEEKINNKKLFWLTIEIYSSILAVLMLAMSIILPLLCNLICI